MNNDLFSKYKDIKAEVYPTLFPDFTLVKKNHCPFCFRKLYEMRSRNLMYCRNKLHKKFIKKSIT